jgi:CPA2 family monovalent cation:H+ antiporter-2
VAFIKRGEITIQIPTKNERLFPGDEVCVIGTDKQVEQFKTYLDKNEIDVPETVTEEDIVLQQFELNDESFIGKSIRESQLRESTHGMVVGLERKGKRILNPDSTTILQKDDIVWIVGERKLLNLLLRKPRVPEKAQI